MAKQIWRGKVSVRHKVFETSKMSVKREAEIKRNRYKRRNCP